MSTTAIAAPPATVVIAAWEKDLGRAHRVLAGLAGLFESRQLPSFTRGGAAFTLAPHLHPINYRGGFPRFGGI